MKHASCSIVLIAIGLALTDPAYGFNNALFQAAATQQRTAPSKIEGVEIELPDFDELFGRIQQVSPLARVAINGNREGKKGFEAIDDSWPANLHWKNVESNKRRTVSQIDKIDNFKGLGSPILRFRSSMEGPCIGECFARFIMDLEERKKWDSQIAQVYERFPIYDLDAVNIAMGFGKNNGECSRLGVGYCQTKPNFAVPSREQLTLCGIQDFPDGACLIWGTEMEEWHNHLLPPGERHTRAKTHIFSTTLVPTSANTFDVEYVLQLDIGGKIPSWLTEPVLKDTVKGLFKTTSEFFGQAGKGGEIDEFLRKKRESNDLDGLAGRNMLLMTP